MHKGWPGLPSDEGMLNLLEVGGGRFALVISWNRHPCRVREVRDVLTRGRTQKGPKVAPFT